LFLAVVEMRKRKSPKATIQQMRYKKLH
jgi:mono/diheme cytochrome c family protein